jgi:hypothetical protein
MPSHSLLSLRLVLAVAMRRIDEEHSDAPRPYRVALDFALPSSALTLSMDQFEAEVLAPALAEAVLELDDGRELARGRDTETAEWPERGMRGAIRRAYDIASDSLPTRADIIARAPRDLYAIFGLPRPCKD